MTSPTNHSRIAVVGSINADLAVTVDRHPKPGETLLGAGGAVSPGGKGSNQAVAAALQGADVVFIGAVGDDAYATEATRILGEVGIDTTAIATVPGPTGLAVITVDKDGENAIVVVAGANAAVDADMVTAHADVLADCGVVLAQGELPAEAVDAAVKACPGRFVLNLGPVIPLSKEVLLAADPLVVNEHEAAGALALLGVEEDCITGEDLAQTLLEAGFRSAVVTMGKKGALVAEQTGVTHVRAQAVPVVDTTGAGDAFTGALAAHLAKGASLVAAAEVASKVAALSVTRPGAQTSYPAASTDLDAALAEASILR